MKKVTSTPVVPKPVEDIEVIVEKQQCYKGHGECDCPGLCRENC